MELMNLATARTSLHQLVDGWQASPGKPVFVGPYGMAEAVIAPLTVWRRLVWLAAVGWDIQSAGARARRLDDPRGPQRSTLVDLSQRLGLDRPPVRVLQGRGVPRGGADLAVWPEALTDLDELTSENEETRETVLRVIADLLQGKAASTASGCGRGTEYTVADVDGLRAAVVTTRPTARPVGRRGPGAHATVELVGVDQIAW
jgi:hypothetical protein